MKKSVQCPNCKEELFFCLDEWGRTPFHLHCDKCCINIGATSTEVAMELIKYCKPFTYIEFFDNRIQLCDIYNDKEEMYGLGEPINE